MPYRAIEKTIDLNVVHNHIASGIVRLRGDDDELKSIFSSITIDEQNKICNWFSSDECDIQLGWGFIADPEILPAIHAVLQSDAVTEKFIGNISPMDMDEGSDDLPTSAWNFGKAIIVEIGYDRSAYAYYLYEIVKHIMLVAEQDFAAIGFKDIMFQGGGRMPIPRLQGGGYIFAYSIQMNYRSLEMIAEVVNLDTIDSVAISQTQDLYQLTDTEP